MLHEEYSMYVRPNGTFETFDGIVGPYRMLHYILGQSPTEKDRTSYVPIQVGDVVYYRMAYMWWLGEFIGINEFGLGTFRTIADCG